ncbi:hypothetical protein [Saliphagus infecundisoli]|uniref:Outer membrane lipoprotein-sorting protein n=1 Tax=Saliphagus infecundisoli TaxID=1849069 RepID=A0ABD5QIZ7_9EURY|nr:hypothetical protein [Saliphagus infecundisoli]
MSRLAAVVLVACLVLTAGCGGFSASSNDPAPDREPYGVEESVDASVEEETEGEQLLPGLTTEGLTNVANLRKVHGDAIGNETFTVRTETESLSDSENESEPRTTETTRYVDPDAGTVFGVTRINQSDADPGSGVDRSPIRAVEQWHGDETLTRFEFENGSVEYPSSGDGSVSRNETVRQAMTGPVVSLGSLENTTTVGTVDAEDGTYYVVEGSMNDSSAIEDGTTREVEVRALVREDGLVRQTVVNQSYGGDGERTTINETIEIVDVGETTVERPDWYDEALAAQPAESASEEANETSGGARTANET